MVYVTSVSAAVAVATDAILFVISTVSECDRLHGRKQAPRSVARPLGRSAVGQSAAGGNVRRLRLLESER